MSGGHDLLTTALDPRLLREAELRMWIAELDALDEKRRPDWPKRRAAAVRVCEMMGIADTLRAVALDGVLRPPPKWPNCDIVPVGGGPGFITAAMRTTTPAGVALEVKLGIVPPQRGQSYQQEVAAAFDRGRHQLQRMIAEQRR